MINVNFPEIRADLNNIFLKKRFVITIIGFLFFVLINYKDELKKVFVKEKEKKLSEIRKVLNKQALNGMLEDIRKRHNADFVAINGFHNNDSSMSRYYEAQSPYKISLQKGIANYPVKPFENSFYILRKQTRLYVFNAHLYKDDLYLAETIKSYGLISVLYVALYDTKTIEADGIYRMIGFLSFEFDKPTEFTEPQLKTMIQEQYLILPYIL